MLYSLNTEILYFFIEDKIKTINFFKNTFIFNNLLNKLNLIQSTSNIFFNSSDYNIILVNMLIITIIASILLVVNYFLRQKSNNWELNTQKYAAYECGFEPFSEAQSHVFEIQFFLVSIMFLIFDIELALMFPWAVYFTFLNKFAFWIMIIFVILLTVGFFYEWKKGALNWNELNIPLKQLSSIIYLWSEEPTFFINNLNFCWVSEYFLAILLVGCLILLVILNSLLITEHVSQIARKVAIIIWAIVLLYYFINFYFSQLTINFYIGNYFIIDSYTQICKFFVISCLLIIFYFCIAEYMYYHKYIIWELPFILLLASFFMILLISAFNLFSLFISLEGLSLCLYVLAAYDFDRRSSTEAAIKYFTLGTLSSGFLLLGIVLVYITVGSLDYLTIYQYTTSEMPQSLLRIGSGLIFFSFLFKLGIWPCHQWVADVYTGVPTIITAIFSTSVKATIFFTLLRLYNYIIIEKPIVAIISIMSLLVGIFGALQTNKIKRFLAYAAINQMGFILLGLFTYSIDVVLLYFIFYILTTIVIFIILLKTISISTFNLQEIIYISDLKTLSFYNQNIRLYLVIILFSMAGLPPFITALTKWYILLILLNHYYLFLCGISIFLTIFSIYYYVRLIKYIFFEDVNLANIIGRPVFYFKKSPSCVLFLNISVTILFIGPVILYVYIYEIFDLFTNLANFCILNLFFCLGYKLCYILLIFMVYF